MFDEFKERDMVMICIRPQYFPTGADKKLHSEKVVLYKIVKKISSKTDVLELIDDMGISNVFNVENALHRSHFFFFIRNKRYINNAQSTTKG